MTKTKYSIQMFYNNRKVAPVYCLDIFHACIQAMNYFYHFHEIEKKTFEAHVLFQKNVLFSIRPSDTPDDVLLHFFQFTAEIASSLEKLEKDGK